MLNMHLLMTYSTVYKEVLEFYLFSQTPFLDGHQTLTDCQVYFPSVFGKMSE